MGKEVEAPGLAVGGWGVLPPALANGAWEGLEGPRVGCS